MLESVPGGFEFAVRDFALVTIAHKLSTVFPGRLVFKGGFVLRHVHGHLRLSKDIDATQSTNQAAGIDANDLALAIRSASIHNVVRFVPGAAAIDTVNSLDFNHIRVMGEVFASSEVQVEISSRERIVDSPVLRSIGAPYYEHFEILTMQPAEMCAEKIRALTQRLRATDLADLAVLIRDNQVDDNELARLVVEKFRLVRRGRANRILRLERNLQEHADTYDDVVRQVFPSAPTYAEAMQIVWPRIARSLG
jgi:predicted nucleotidyltransferase component of viral defense system